MALDERGFDENGLFPIRTGIGKEERDRVWEKCVESYNEMLRQGNQSVPVDESAVRPLNVEFPALGKRDSPSLAGIGYRIYLIGNEFQKALRTSKPLDRTLSMDKSKSEPDPVVLTEEENISIRNAYDDIENKLVLAKASIKEWDRVKRNPNLMFVAREVNQAIGTIEGHLLSINKFLKWEPWFNSWQGTNDDGNIYKRTQLIYKEYVETVIEFFKRTDEEHEKTKNNPDESKRVEKAPAVVNLLRPEALRPPSPG